MSLDYAQQVLDSELDAIRLVRNRLDGNFIRAIDHLSSSTGRIITCGMGKAGIISQKIAATLSSTGSAAFFLHPADALHGDLGMVNKGDVVLLLSNSGESDEVTRLLPCLRRVGVSIISITGNDRSTLAAHSDITLIIGDIAEACPLGLAPTATTTAMLALGDAIALCLMKRRGFQIQDYAQLHPAGALGRKTLPIDDVMRIGEAVAVVSSNDSVSDTLLAITNARSGSAVVVDDKRKVIGIFCDGDLRRGIKNNRNILQCKVVDAMTSDCTTVTSGVRAGAVLDIMREKRIAEIPVINDKGELLGMADLKGMLASM